MPICTSVSGGVLCGAQQPSALGQRHLHLLQQVAQQCGVAALPIHGHRALTLPGMRGMATLPPAYGSLLSHIPEPSYTLVALTIPELREVTGEAHCTHLSLHRADTKAT